MNFNLLDNITNSTASKVKQALPGEDALRKAAMQFEAILLMQLTSALNGSGSDEDSLFGSDGGSGLAKQMFSEQLANVMAESGGVGLQDLILQKFGLNQANLSAKNQGSLLKTISAVKDIRENTSAANNLEAQPVYQNASINNAESAVSLPAVNETIPNQNFSDSNNRAMLGAEAPKTERPRIVPNQPISTFEGNVSALTDNSPRTLSYEIPVKGRISSNFGTRFHPVDKVRKFHGGIDIAVPRGTTVGAATEGVVTFAGWRGGYGNLVIVQHPDGRETRYGHLDKLLVKEGDEVFTKQPIALSGSTGKSTGPHLHFEVRENGTAVNPLKILSNVLPKNTDK